MKWAWQDSGRVRCCAPSQRHGGETLLKGSDSRNTSRRLSSTQEGGNLLDLTAKPFLEPDLRIAFLHKRLAALSFMFSCL